MYYYIWHLDKKQYQPLRKVTEVSVSMERQQACAIDLGDDWSCFEPYVRYGFYVQRDGTVTDKKEFIICFSCCGRIISHSSNLEHASRKAKRRLQKESRKCVKYVKYFMKKQGVPQGFDLEELSEYCDYLREEVFCE